MDELISRQAVLDIAFKYCPDDDGVCSEAGSDLRNMLDEIENLPTEEPKRIKGTWIEMLSYMNHTYKCSECGRLLVNVTDGKNNVSKHYPFCHCGADMRGVQDG